MAMISVFHTDDRGSIPRRGILLRFWILLFWSRDRQDVFSQKCTIFNCRIIAFLVKIKKHSNSKLSMMLIHKYGMHVDAKTIWDKIYFSLRCQIKILIIAMCSLATLVGYRVLYVHRKIDPLPTGRMEYTIVALRHKRRPNAGS